MPVFNTRSALSMKLSVGSDEFLQQVIDDKGTYSATARRLARFYQNQRLGLHPPMSKAQQRAVLMGQVKFFCTGMVGQVNSLQSNLRTLKNTDANTQEAEYLVGCIDTARLYLNAAVAVADTINRMAIQERLDASSALKLTELTEGKLL